MEAQLIVDNFFQSKKNANCLLELEELLLSKNTDNIFSSIDAFQEIFVRIFDTDLLIENSNADSIHEKYRTWLLERYKDFIEHLLNYIQDNNEIIQDKALEALMKLVEIQGKKHLNIELTSKWYFPEDLMKEIISHFLSPILDQEHLIKNFKDYLTYQDIKFYTLKSILNSLNQTNQASEIFLKNCFLLLSQVHFPSEKNLDPSYLYIPLEVEQPPSILKKNVFQRMFSSTWIRFFKYELPPDLYKKILIILHKKVLPHMKNPCLLTDFLTDSYKKGNIISLLSLNSIFFLMDKYNIEYPDFFTKLYALFTKEIINGKFHARFFFLSDIFLSSTHLPAYIVAAFIKRLSRISLYAKTNIILIIVPFICNLLRRHPTLKILIHRTDPQTFDKDPYDFLEADPAKSNAMESSLWEIKSLQSHVNPDVSRKAKVINSEISKIEEDISDLLEISMHDLYKKERNRAWTEAPLAIHKPSTESWFQL